MSSDLNKPCPLPWPAQDFWPAGLNMADKSWQLSTEKFKQNLLVWEGRGNVRYVG